MINKSVFEADLIAGMQRELRPFEKKAGMNALPQAVDYLNSAVEILEEAGMHAKADQVLRILGKIAIAAAHDSKVREMPSLKKLMEAGVTHQDLKNTNDPLSKARVNTAMRVLGYTDREIHHFLGDKFMTEKDASDMLDPERPYGKLMDWIQNPAIPVNPNNVQPGEEISMDSVRGPQVSSPNDGQILNIKSLANDKHTHGLTSEKMVSNLEDHGTVFNMADDGSGDESFSDDLLDLDINEATLELQGNPEDKTFEDSD